MIFMVGLSFPQPAALRARREMRRHDCRHGAFGVDAEPLPAMSAACLCAYASYDIPKAP
jgi:hypothetical protein